MLPLVSPTGPGVAAAADLGPAAAGGGAHPEGAARALRAQPRARAAQARARGHVAETALPVTLQLGGTATAGSFPVSI